MRRKYIRRSMLDSFNMLDDRGQNAHREICGCSALSFFAKAGKTQNFFFLKVLRFVTCYNGEIFDLKLIMGYKPQTTSLRALSNDSILTNMESFEKI